MKKLGLSVLFLATTLTISGARAQVSVLLHAPPPGQLNVERLWWVDLDNRTRETYRDVWLHGEVHEATRGPVYRANSNRFDLPPGRMTLRYRDIQVRDQWHAPGYEVFLIRSGQLPAGEYEFYVWLEPDLGGDTVRFKVEDPTAPRLVAPRRGARLELEPVFSWTRPRNWTGAITYELRVVEVLSGQTEEEALRANRPVFTKGGIRTTMLRYPVAARKLDPGKSYAWQVKAEFGRGVQPKVSEQWGFGRYKFRPEILGKGPLKVKREVTRHENWFRVELTLTNTGSAALGHIVVTDSHRYFQCLDDAWKSMLPPPGGWPPGGMMVMPGPATAVVRSSDGGFRNTIGIDLEGYVLLPDRSLTVRYSALPLLTFSLQGPGHTIGEGLKVTFESGGNQYLRTFNDQAVNPVPGLADAWRAADYIISTCPAKLQGPDEDVDALLVAMARLAGAREGALLYFTNSLSSATSARSIFKAFGTVLRNGWQNGYLLIVGEEEVVPHRPDFTDWFKKEGVWTESPVFTRSDYYYSDLSGDERPEIAVGRVVGRNAAELKIPIDVSLSVKSHGAENDGSHTMMISGHEKIGDVFPIVAESGAAYLRRERSTTVACWHGEYYTTRPRILHKAIIHAKWEVNGVRYDADKCCKYCSPRPCGCGCSCLNGYDDREMAAWLLREVTGAAAFDAQYPPDPGDLDFVDSKGRHRRVPKVFDDSHIGLAANDAAQIEFARGGYFGASHLFLPTTTAAHDLFVSRMKAKLAGRDFIVYNGHSGASGWYGVDYATVRDADIMSSSTRPIAVCFGCSGGHYSGASNSISRVFLRYGAGAYVGATQMINTADANNHVRDKGFLKHWARGKRIGDVHRDWKYDMASHTILASGLDLRLLHVMNLYGDPKFGGD